MEDDREGELAQGGERKALFWRLLLKKRKHIQNQSNKKFPKTKEYYNILIHWTVVDSCIVLII